MKYALLLATFLFTVANIGSAQDKPSGTGQKETKCCKDGKLVGGAPCNTSSVPKDEVGGKKGDTGKPGEVKK